MIDTEHITLAIASHAKWDYHLKQAIKTGTSEWDVPDVRVDDKCEFGKWLGSVPLVDKLGEHWRTVKSQHAEFHQAAADVLELALAGRRDEAEAAIAPDGRYAQTSQKLTLAMVAWKAAATT